MLYIRKILLFFVQQLVDLKFLVFEPAERCIYYSPHSGG